MMERSIYKIRNGKKTRVFTSNREILYPKLKEIARKGERARGNLKKYIKLIEKLLEIAEEMEQIVSINIS